MPMVIANSVAGGSGTPYVLAATDSIIVGSSGVVFSTDTHAITGSGEGQFCTVLGSVTSASHDALHLGTGTEAGMRVTIGATGYIQGADDGISLDSAGGLVQNFGTVTATYGIYMEGSTSSLQTVLNTGTINAALDGVLMGDINGQLNLTNHGLIIGLQRSYGGANGADVVVNRGRMVGDVEFSAGNDRYDGRGGTVEGQIRGGNGDDSFLLGAGAESVDGGAGFDTLDFSTGVGLRVSLLPTQPNTGAAAGDSYLGIEQVIGSALGNDVIGGSATANLLRGLGGADRLSGGGGGDRLIGGTGIDTLTGGTGSDGFQFQFLGDGGDRISDFSNVAGNNDVFRIDASNFGGGLAAGALAANQFRARADNQAQDGDDRFIFRTTDATLWFDANGNVAGAGVLVADLQAGAVLTAADILLI